MDRTASHRPGSISRLNPLQRAHLGLAACVALVGGLSAGCVDRTVKINSEPEGALVYLNDQEVGRSPVKVNFTWYGDYDIIIRQKGYKTIQTHRRIDAPWYQWPGIDLISECLIPATIHDDRDLGTFKMEQLELPDKDELIRRAEEMRSMAVGDAMTEPEVAPAE